MVNHQADMDLDANIWRKLGELDLGCIKVKLVSTEHGEGWSKEKANQVEKAYKQFLYINQKYPNKTIAVNKTIDTFWHFHILDTLKYHEDCMKIFGHYVHHFPYFGMRGDEDAKRLREAYLDTLTVFEKEFGILDPAVFGKETAADCANVCTTPCDSPRSKSYVGPMNEVSVAADCANVCNTPCDSPGKHAELERPQWVAA